MLVRNFLRVGFVALFGLAVVLFGMVATGEAVAETPATVRAEVIDLGPMLPPGFAVASSVLGSAEIDCAVHEIGFIGFAGTAGGTNICMKWSAQYPTITLVLQGPSSIVADFGPQLDEVIAEISTVSTVNFVVADRTDAEVNTMSLGEITIEMAPEDFVSQQCGAEFVIAGCAGPSTENASEGWDQGRVWLSDPTADYPPVDRRSLIAHELGHALGLGHFDDLFEGKLQIMHSSSWEAPSYESGDLRGLNYMLGSTIVTPTPTPTPTPTSTPVSHVPSGTTNSYATANLEELEPGPGEIRVHGWSFDPDLPTKDLVVHVYAFFDGVGDPVALDTPVVRAADFRPDVNRAFGIGGDHGFNRTLAIRNGNHRVCVYSLSVDETGELDGLNQLIGCRYVTVTDEAPPRGAFDQVTQTGTSMNVSGWAYDLDSENQSLDIAVHLDGVPFIDILANQTRPDVNEIVGISGDHGFNSTFTVPAGGHTVCLYAIGIDPSGARDDENVLLSVVDKPDCRITAG
ncbi:MAG: hypothetical protein ACKVKO_08405 [Acidimicrobiales bacterium]